MRDYHEDTVSLLSHAQGAEGNEGASHTSGLTQRFKTANRRSPASLFRFVRFAAVLLLTSVWWILSWLLSPRVVFLVYGNERLRRLYWPAWLEPLLPLVFPVGFIRYKRGWGLIATTKAPEEHMDSNIHLIGPILNAACRLFPRARTMALAGRLPSWARRAKVDVKRPMLDGLRGTIFTVIQAVNEAAKRYNLVSSSIVVAVIGGKGYVGAQIVEQLARVGGYRQVIAIDPLISRITDDKRTLSTRRAEAVSQAKIVVNLAPRGSDMSTYVPYLSLGTIVLDDTHPVMHGRIRSAVEARGTHLWRVVVQDPTLRMVPRLPDFSANWVPGCLLEALVVQHVGWCAVEGTQDDFDRAAIQAGLVPQLFRHTDDP